MTESTIKRSDGPTRSTGPNATGYRGFAKATFDADGEWVEMPMDATRQNHAAAVARHLIKHLAEIAVRDGVIYARVKK